jgi:predicted ATPase
LRGREKLNYDGKNIAEYLLWLRTEAPEDFSNLIRKMQFVLPYIKDLVPHVLEQTVNKEVEILLYEKQHNSKPLPGWLLSSGTLRILALLAMFDTPDKPTVLFIDEIENGLDPRTIGLLLSQIESVFTTRSMQVVVSTHSPYFLDLVPIESLIVSEKDAGGSSYHIPKDENSLQKWRERFSPGKLYTMGKLTK